MESILERAMKIKVRPKAKEIFTDEEVQLAIAWAKGKIGYAQVSKVLDKSTAEVYLFLARALKQHLSNKK